MGILKSFLKFFVRTSLEKRRRELREKLEDEMAVTDSQTVIMRNSAWLAVLDSANGKVIDAIEKQINKM